uniref:Uncharacterized protein n=1 Tax=Anguilla anguilla TaxID=7936 RepID=A0A0E9VX37_ANGAN
MLGDLVFLLPVASGMDRQYFRCMYSKICIACAYVIYNTGLLTSVFVWFMPLCHLQSKLPLHQVLL